VTIKGTNLTTGSVPVVDFGLTNAPGIATFAATKVVVEAPPAPAPGTVDITVTTDGGTSAVSPADEFTYVEPPPTTVYLALGDSLAFGYTQQKFEENFPNEAPTLFEAGYDNVFATYLHSTFEGITIVNEGCPGETSDGLIGHNAALGGGPGAEYAPCAYANVEGFPLHYGYGTASQLEEALSFLNEGKPTHEIKAITLNIGVNDELAAVTQCEKEVEEEFVTQGKSQYGLTPEEAFKGCIASHASGVFKHIAENITHVLSALDSTAPGGGHYAGRIVVLGYYNPSSFVLPGSDVLQKALNETLEKEVIPNFANARYANPFPAFNPQPERGTAEKAAICKYTEMCNAHDIAVNKANAEKSGKPFNGAGDYHPTEAGYSELAKLIFAKYQ
jgi:lysophospholipase L1-like esterase